MTSPTPEPQSNLISFRITTYAPSRVPPDFPREVLEAMPEWKSMFVDEAQFIARLEAPLTADATPISITQVYSTYPEGTGDWGAPPIQILVRGYTPQAKLEDLILRVRAVYGDTCNIQIIPPHK